MFSINARTTLLLALMTAGACSYADAPKPVPTNSPASPPGSAQTSRASDLRSQPPAGWVAEQTSSSMRVAQYRLPRAEGDPEDAQLVLYFFGAGQGGSVEANLDRWIGQMQQPDGRPSREKAKTEVTTVNGLKVTLLDVTGTYNAEMAPGSGTRHNSAGYRMRAAVIETPRGPYFAKLVGPQNTVAKWDGDFKKYMDSFEFK